MPDSVLVVLERLADVGQKRTGDEVIAIDWNAAPERSLQNIRDGDALTGAGIEMLDEFHVDVAGQERELYRAQFGEGPAFSAATGGDRFIPHRRHFFAQRPLLDLQEAGEKLSDLFYTVFGWLSFHTSDVHNLNPKSQAPNPKEFPIFNLQSKKRVGYLEFDLIEASLKRGLWNLEFPEGCFSVPVRRNRV